MLDKIPGIDKILEDDTILVTGGTGLFGKAVKDIVKQHKIVGNWVFLSSKDADLRNISVPLLFY
jgi:FlaA1/EpsC-like NDP-sugar epimerase